MRVIKIVDNKVTEVKQVLDSYIINVNEIESTAGELGQIMQPDGTFIDDPTPIPPPRPTLEEQQSALEERVGMAEDAINFLLML